MGSYNQSKALIYTLPLNLGGSSRVESGRAEGNASSDASGTLNRERHDGIPQDQPWLEPITCGEGADCVVIGQTQICVHVNIAIALEGCEAAVKTAPYPLCEQRSASPSSSQPLGLVNGQTQSEAPIEAKESKTASSGPYLPTGGRHFMIFFAAILAGALVRGVGGAVKSSC